jgi:ABC-type sugar transport system ATPase subunit
MVGTDKTSIAAAVQDAAEKVRIAHLLDRKPGQLSGGQQQRCALARAIVRKPRLFLLDEPLSNLDAKLRLETRGELKRLQRSLGVTAVYVTHDQEEAMTVADRMAVFMEGRIAQVGTPDEVFQRPATLEVAAFLGSPPMNLLEARVEGNEIELGGTCLQLPRSFGDARRVIAGLRPSALTFGDAGIAGRVDLIEQLGEATIVSVLVGDRLVRVRADRRPPVHEGEEVRVAFAVDELHLFDPATNKRV